MRADAAKRALDLLLTVPGLVVISPILVGAAAWVWLDSPGPVFFRQERVGRGGKHFRIWKFRSMHVAQGPDAPQVTSAGDSRITRAGAVLRRFKIDELPQLFNVVLGEMSLVGPRPEVPRYVACYPSLLRDKILSVAPGITDIASIEFRNENDLLAGVEDPDRYYRDEILPVKLKLAEQYVDQRSLALDLRLILRTIGAVLGLEMQHRISE